MDIGPLFHLGVYILTLNIDIISTTKIRLLPVVVVNTFVDRSPAQSVHQIHTAQVVSIQNAYHVQKSQLYTPFWTKHKPATSISQCSKNREDKCDPGHGIFGAFGDIIDEGTCETAIDTEEECKAAAAEKWTFILEEVVA